MSDDIIGALSQPFHFALIGKFSHDRPSMDTMKKDFHTLGLKADFSIGHLDSKHLLIKVNHV